MFDDRGELRGNGDPIIGRDQSDDFFQLIDEFDKGIYDYFIARYVYRVNLGGIKVFDQCNQPINGLIAFDRVLLYDDGSWIDIYFI